MAWLTDWIYRKSHAITAAAGAGTGYQKRITAHYEAPHYQHTMLEDVDSTLKGCGENNQRQSFYGKGLYWVFYCDDDNIVYKTSRDGVTWSVKTVIRVSNRLYKFSILYDAGYLYYMEGDYIANMKFRRGIPNVDGTITWTSAEVVAVSHIGTSPIMAKDSAGKIWCVYWKPYAPDDGFYVTKNDATDGTWSTAVGYPLKLAASIDEEGRAQGSICALTDGKMYAGYGKINAAEDTTTVVYGKLYNGSIWGSEETISDYILTLGGGITVSVDAKDDDVYITYFADTGDNNQVGFNKRTYGVGWGSNEYITPDAAGYSGIAMTFDPTTEELWVFYANVTTEDIYVRKRTSSGWRNAEKIYDFSGIHDIEGFNVCAWRRPWDGYPACQFDTNTGATNKAWWLSYAHDINEHVYLSENCRTDFGDVRFTDDDETTVLDSWMQEKTNSDYAIFWVEINDDLSTVAQSIYIYYDNASATYPVGADQDEMDATFLFADHFYGSSLDTDKWDEANSPTIVVSGGTITITSSTEDWRGILSDDTFGAYGVAWISRNKFSADARTIAGMSNTGVPASDDEMSFLSPTLPRSRVVNEGSYADIFFVIGAGAFHLYDITWKAGECKFYVDGVLKSIHTSDIPNEAMKSFFVAYNTAQESDWIVLRKFVDPEPAHSTWGNVEGIGGAGEMLLGCLF